MIGDIAMTCCIQAGVGKLVVGDSSFTIYQILKDGYSGLFMFGRGTIKSQVS